MSLATSLALLATAAQPALDTVLTHGAEPSGVSGFPNPGTWLIFGVILMPIYAMVIAWFLGKPRDVKTGLMGVVYLVGITTGMWVSMFIGMEIVGLIFY